MQRFPSFTENAPRGFGTGGGGGGGGGAALQSAGSVPEFGEKKAVGGVKKFPSAEEFLTF